MIKKLINTYRTYTSNKTAYWQLMNMTDRQLRDLGICRGDIKRLTMQQGAEYMNYIKSIYRYLERVVRSILNIKCNCCDKCQCGS